MGEVARQPAAEHPSLVYRLMLRVGVPAALQLWSDLHVEGAEHLPAEGACILVSNHVDNLDTYAIGMRVARTIHFLARPSGLEARWLGRYWRLMAAIPADRGGLAQAMALLKGGEVVGVYPDGIITPQMVQAKAGVAALAVRSGAAVVPVAVWGTERVRLWPLHHPRPRVCVRFGPPRTFDRSSVRGVGLQAVADSIMTSVAALLPPEYRGYYAAAVDGACPRPDGVSPHERRRDQPRPAHEVPQPMQSTQSNEGGG